MEWFCVTFVIDLDNVWQWLGFSQKVNATKVLEKNFGDWYGLQMFALQVDKAKSDGRGGHNKDTYLLEVWLKPIWC